ncbi:MAG TPA: hypothetical protein VK906_09510, partial [Egicoccus sp.]
DAGLVLLAPLPALAGSRFRDATVLAWSLRWEVALGPVVARFADADVEVVDSVGLGEEFFVFTPGARGDAALLERAVAAASGPVVERPATPSPTPDPDAGDDASGVPDEPSPAPSVQGREDGA